MNNNGIGVQPRLHSVSDLIRCQIRGRWIPANPEELVRQSLLIALLDACQDLVPGMLDIRVEYTSLDIAIYPAPHSPIFCPALPPLLIIETKRREIHPVDTVENAQQLTGYLQRTCCPTGILTNGRAYWCYQQQGERFHKTALPTIAALVQLLRSIHQQTQRDLARQYQQFERARSGCFASFRDLVYHYGCSADSTITFVYEYNHEPLLAAGFLCKVTDTEVHFMLRGQTLARRQICTAQTFRHLVAIQSLG